MSTVLVVPSHHLILCLPFLLLPLFFPSTWSFPVGRLFTSGGHSIRASASFPPMNIQDWFPLGLTGLILQSKGLSRVFSSTTSKASVLQCSAFFMVQLSRPYVTAGKTIALTIQTFVDKVMSLIFNTLCRFVIAFLPRGKLSFNFVAIVMVCSDFGAHENKICHCFQFFPLYLP